VFREDAHVRHLLGRVRLEQQRRDLALYDFEAALRLAPTHPNASWTRLQVERLRARNVRPAPDEPSTPVP
jgi:cytochrome c-type biogenesis protein CcmH/NrfG